MCVMKRNWWDAVLQIIDQSNGDERKMLPAQRPSLLLSDTCMHVHSSTTFIESVNFILLIGKLARMLHNMHFWPD